MKEKMITNITSLLYDLDYITLKSIYNVIINLRKSDK